MKTILILSIIIFLFSSCTKQPANLVTVKGQVTGNIPEEIKYSVPVNGICYDWFSNAVPVDSTGHFEFSVNTEGPCFITFYLWGNRGQLIAEPGKNYNVNFEINDEGNKLSFDCYNKVVQKTYQSLESPLHPQMEAMNFWNLPIGVVHNKIDSALDSETLVFKQLLDNGAILKELFDLVVFDRSLYYNSVLAQVATYKFVNAKRQDIKANTDSINKMWEEAVLRVPLNSIDLLKSKWAYYYIQNYLLYKEYMEEGFNWDIRRNARQEERFHTYLVAISKKLLSGKSLEFYDGAYILSMARQDKFEKELISLFEDFKTKFPESKYTPFLEPEIEKIVDLHKIAKLEFDEKIIFVDDYKNIKSMDEFLKILKGRKIYIDNWTTSCGPCKKEFKFSPELTRMLNAKNVTMLYISHDNDEYENRWLEMIKYYNLKGYHIRATKELQYELDSVLNIQGIPHYAIIDENGKIINSDAPRPSEMNELEKIL